MKHDSHMPLVVGILLALGSAGFGAVYLRHQLSQDREEIRDLLKAVGDLKAAQIVNWRQDRLGDARVFAESSVFVRDVRMFFNNPSSEQLRADVLQWLRLIKTDDRYFEVRLYDNNLSLRLSLPEKSDTPLGFDSSLLTAALRDKKASITDLHRSKSTKDIRLATVIPVYCGNDPSATPIGVLVLQTDPSQFLYPLIQSWPTPSRSAETLLVRRDGNDILFLNELRHRTNTALEFRLPLNASLKVACAMAINGHTGCVEAVDYRGVRVLAAVRSVPDSPWSIVAKVDREEVYEPLRMQAALMLALTLLLATGSVLVMRLVSKHREAAYAQLELAAERQRRVLAERVEYLMKSANDAILLLDDQWKILEANDRALEMYGYSLPELQNRYVSALRTEQARENFGKAAARVSLEGHAVYETAHMRKDGSVFPVEVSVRNVELAEGRCKLSIVRDISQRVAHEREIERLNRLYATLSQINQSIVRVESRQRLFDEVCRVAVEFGVFKLVWIGWHDPETQQVRPVAKAGHAAGFIDGAKIYADDRPEGRGCIGTCIRENRTCIINDFSSDPRSEPWRDMAAVHEMKTVAALPIRLQGKVCGALVVHSSEAGGFPDKEVRLLEEIAIDISFALDHLQQDEKRQLAEEALRQSESLYRAIARSIPDGGVFVVDRNTRYLVADGPYLEKMGMARHSLEGRTLHEVAAERALVFVEERFFSALAGESASYETEIRGRLVWAQYVPLYDDNGHVMAAMALCLDITEQRRVEMQLLRSQRLDSVGRLAGGIAHDLNNILTPMLVAAPMLRRFLQNPQSFELVDAIESSARRGAEITKRLLTFSRGMPGQRRPLQLAPLLREMVRIIVETFPKNIEVSEQIGDGVAAVNGDSTQLHQVLMNLCVNARDAMPKGGKLTLWLENQDVDESTAQANPGAHAGAHVVLTVLDTGVGIGPEDVDRIFDPFFTTKRPGEGTGLGLATVLGIVRSHGGFIQVQSSPGKGTGFKIYLPACDVTPDDDADKASAAPLPKGNGEWLLVVDDELQLRRVVRQILEESGYRVIEAKDGNEALAAFQINHDKLRAVVTDLLMPGMDGVTLISELRKKNAPVKIIAMSGHLQPELHQQVQSQTEAFVSKPFSASVLLQTLSRVLSS